MRELDPYENAVFSVAWAGENVSANWFHIARVYTEKWHHQQQVWFSVGKEDELLQTELYVPFLDTVMRALPYHYRTIDALKNDVILFAVSER